MRACNVCVCLPRARGILIKRLDLYFITTCDKGEGKKGDSINCMCERVIVHIHNNILYYVIVNR